MIDYRKLTLPQLQDNIQEKFDRYQEVWECWRKLSGTWQLADAPFTEDWTDEDKKRVIRHLRDTLQEGGCVVVARENGMLVGLASLARTPFGSRNQYVRLTGMHVSRDHRGMGIGTGLFHLVKDVAEGWGAEKIYISTQSSKETQAFYAAMGCVDAQETNLQAAQSGPLDRQLECAL